MLLYLLVVARVEGVGDDAPEDLGRDAPQRREAAARAAAAVGGGR